jgi:hypothetical protein
MISNSTYKEEEKDISYYEENIAKILDRAVKLFRRTNLEELADKWDRILKTYNSKNCS